MSSELSNFSIYVLLASCVMLMANGAAFLYGVWDYSRFLSNPDRPPNEPLVPNKPLLGGFLTAVAIFLVACFLPLIGEHDEATLRFTLAFSILLFAGTAVPCWHLVFGKNADEIELPKPTRQFFVAATLALIAWNGVILLANPDLEVAENNPLAYATLDHPVILFLFVIIALCAPVSEEIVYRGVIQTWVGKIANNALTGGVVAGLLFAIAHAGMVETPGVKELQILGLAALFGWARWKYGLTASIALHFINNAMALILHLIAQVFDLGAVPPT
jgi:membrane protease YdiL (CAAX protease family)